MWTLTLSPSWPSLEDQSFDPEQNIKEITTLASALNMTSLGNKELMDLAMSVAMESGDSTFVTPDVVSNGLPASAHEARLRDYDQDAIERPSEAKHPSEGEASDRPKRQKTLTWIRDDWWCTRFQTAAPTGPNLDQVFRRVTKDRNTGELLENLQVDVDNTEISYAGQMLGQERRNLQTTLFYTDKLDVSEIRCPPRIVVETERQGLRGGLSLDLTVKKKDGKALDFSLKAMRDAR